MKAPQQALLTAGRHSARTAATRRPRRLVAAAMLGGGALLALLLALLLPAAGPAHVSAQEAPPVKPAADPAAAAPENPFPNRVPAAGLEGGVDWLNTTGEITLKDLRGKVVLLDFWTYCCINCIHVLPDLAYLEKKYPNELVVIGVHSAKFDNEKDSEAIRQAILRYEIEHPVINDANMTIWRKFGVRAWPTVALIDPEGYYCGSASGEGNRALLDEVIGKVIEHHRAKGTLDETPVHFNLERAKAEPTPLRFPGKVLADADRDRLFISDSNHNRIVVTTLDGTLVDVIGTGAIGADDGGYDTATFDHPQGMTLVGETLYVADTENHLIRTVDLAKKQVATLAGTGEQDRVRTPGGRLTTTPLNSPWDLAHVDGTLYIAMAGPHQIWSHRLGTDQIGVFAGSGREDITDGSLTGAALAQPSGLAHDGQFLYVVDSEGSAIRKIELKAGGSVSTIVGASNLPSGRSLFEFGDVDGVGGTARLQHPLGIAHGPGVLYVADSYNHKLKTIDLESRRATTFLGTGTAGSGSDPWQFSEPAGLSLAGQTLYVADTNNHRICAVDVATRQARVLEIAGLAPPAPARSEALPVAKGEPTRVAPQRVASGEELAFEVAFQLPEGYKLNPLAPVTYRLEAGGAQTLVNAAQLDVRAEAEASEKTARIVVPLASSTGKGELLLAVTYSYCRDGVGGLCKFGTARWQVPVQVEPGGEPAVRLEVTAE